MRKVLAILPVTSSGPGRTEAELLTAAKRLASGLSGEFDAAILGPGADRYTQEVLSRGAKRAWECADGMPAEYQTESVAAAVEQVIRACGAEIALLAGNTCGLEIGPLVAHKIGAAVVIDCTEVAAEDGGVRIIKPVYGGKAVARLRAKQGPLVVVMRLHAVVPEEPQGMPDGERIPFTVTLDPAGVRSRLVERQVEETGGERLEDARVIVSGGRGIGGKENFVLLGQLAREIGGVLGASRAACDAGWVPASWQIGQTGKKVAPELYLAVGISGASQHMVGVGGAKHIVAVNKDPKAPIFQRAELGIVEEYQTFIPALIAAIQQRKSSA